jgi:hypothetical protein
VNAATSLSRVRRICAEISVVSSRGGDVRVHRVGALGHVCSDEAYEEMRDAGAFPEDPVEWAQQILLVERMRGLFQT